MNDKESLYDKVQALQDLLIARATGEIADDREYISLRSELLSHPEVNARMPAFVIRCRQLSQFWPLIKGRFSTYAERRQYIWSEFRPSLDYLETGVTPIEVDAAVALEKLDSKHVRGAWQRASERRMNDPEGAITAAKSLLESVCKHILDEQNLAYAPNADLPKLYSAASATLNLAPAQHAEQIFRQILGSCQQIVEGLGSLRNRFGDAHGKGKAAVKPLPRHAELAVNLAGSMATFLVSTWESRRTGGSHET
jgi:hypothetical protein